MPGKSSVVMLLLAVTSTNVLAQVQDTIQRKTPLFVAKDALLLGAFTLGTAVVAPVDRAVAARLQNPGAQENRYLRAAATGLRSLAVPGSLIAGAGLYAIGRADGQARVQSMGLHSIESILIADAIGSSIKLLTGRQRPYVDITDPYDFQLLRGLSSRDYRSFPSGHTITAFAFAASVTRETQFWSSHAGFYAGTVFYGGATLMGISRIYNNQHWASDVIGGAAIGTLIGLKVVKYTHSHPGNRIDRALIKARRSGIATPVIVSLQF